MSDQDLGEPADFTRRELIARGGALAAALLAGAAACSRPAGCDARERDDTEQSPPGDAATDKAEKAHSGDDARAESSTSRPEGGRPPEEYPDWEAVRDQFDATHDVIHMAGLLLATHPKPVREAIERHRRGLDSNPSGYLLDRWGLPDHRHDEEAEWRVRRAAGRYLDMSRDNIALTENTTTGLATVYNGIGIREDQEALSGHWNHWATEGTLEYRAQKQGFDTRRAVLYDTLDESVTSDQLVDRLIDEVSERTRIVAVTWVHSISGLKLPVGEIGRRIQELNDGRDDDDRILYCIDGVHGFGVENAVMEDFNCDFFVAGCHKWLFGPRGTGIVAASPDAWQYATPTVPSFSGDETQGRRFTPGGFKSFEHRWALEQAFEFQLSIGKERIQERIHALTQHLLEGLSKMDHVALRTPTNPELTAGIVTFEVDGVGTYDVVARLEQDGIIASTTPESGSIPRLSPGLLNNHDQIEQVLAAVAQMGGG